jgi:hypothetical protein
MAARRSRCACRRPSFISASRATNAAPPACFAARFAASVALRLAWGPSAGGAASSSSSSTPPAASSSSSSAPPAASTSNEASASASASSRAACTWTGAASARAVSVAMACLMVWATSPAITPAASGTKGGGTTSCRDLFAQRRVCCASRRRSFISASFSSRAASLAAAFSR